MTSPGPSPHRLGGARAAAASGHARRRHRRTSLPFTPSPGYGGCARRRARAVATAITASTAAVVAVAGCGGSQPSVALPAPATPLAAPASVTPAASPSPVTGTRHGAIAAYMSIWPAGDRAERSGRAARARAILASYATPSYTRFMIGGMRGFWRRHELATGYMTDHVMRATVATSRSGQQAAIVVDCQDARHHQLTQAATGRAIPGTRGPRRARLYASLTFSGGRWLVNQITYVSGAC